MLVFIGNGLVQGSEVSPAYPLLPGPAIKSQLLGSPGHEPDGAAGPAAAGPGHGGHGLHRGQRDAGKHPRVAAAAWALSWWPEHGKHLAGVGCVRRWGVISERRHFL